MWLMLLQPVLRSVQPHTQAVCAAWHLRHNATSAERGDASLALAAARRTAAQQRQRAAHARRSPEQPPAARRARRAAQQPSTEQPPMARRAQQRTAQQLSTVGSDSSGSVTSDSAASDSDSSSESGASSDSGASSFGDADAVGERYAARMAAAFGGAAPQGTADAPFTRRPACIACTAHLLHRAQWSYAPLHTCGVCHRKLPWRELRRVPLEELRVALTSFTWCGTTYCLSGDGIHAFEGKFTINLNAGSFVLPAADGIAVQALVRRAHGAGGAFARTRLYQDARLEGEHAAKITLRSCSAAAAAGTGVTISGEETPFKWAAPMDGWVRAAFDADVLAAHAALEAAASDSERRAAGEVIAAHEIEGRAEAVGRAVFVEGSLAGFQAGAAV